ncbi:MAG: HD domain-containing protein [Fibrobacteres bacterium]|nr:HD domain-containing protein [Fibrobacterota bacterium]
MIKKAIKFIRQLQSNDSTGHDFWHSMRVYRMAVHIAKKEKADLKVTALAALLHDVEDWKFTEKSGKVQKWLKRNGASAELTKEVCGIIEHVSYKGAGVADKMVSLEGQIVQDADRLDALGAIGIARTFAYGGSKGRAIYDPEVKPVMHATFKSYKKNQSHSINHFYEKLLLLKNRMHTKTAKKIAGERHRRLEIFLQDFMDEWNA